jgi:hypothetical protein
LPVYLLKSFSENRTFAVTTATAIPATPNSSGSKFGNPAAEAAGAADGSVLGDGVLKGMVEVEGIGDGIGELFDGADAIDGKGSCVDIGVGLVEGMASSGSSCCAGGNIVTENPNKSRARDIPRIGANNIFVFGELMF